MEHREHFKAVFNPFTRTLVIEIYDEIKTVFFKDLDEWMVVDIPNFEKDYLHIHLDYDEFLSLSVYFRKDRSDDYGKSEYWEWDGNDNSKLIDVVYTEYELCKLNRKHFKI